MFNNNNRGQVGIGTLIVFIAMVLVAAIAAGVLINTAGLLQSQAEATGQESSEQVTDGVQISTVIGTVGESDLDGETADTDDQLTNGELDRVALTTLRSPGAGDIDLTNAIIEVFANGESDTLTWDSDATDENFDLEAEYEVGIEGGSVADDTANNNIDGFAVVNVQGADDGTLSDSSDRAQLVFDLSEISAGDEASLQSGETVTVTVTTAAGATAFVEKRAPSTLEEGETYRL